MTAFCCVWLAVCTCISNTKVLSLLKFYGPKNRPGKELSTDFTNSVFWGFCFLVVFSHLTKMLGLWSYSATTAIFSHYFQHKSMAIDLILAGLKFASHLPSHIYWSANYSLNFSVLLFVPYPDWLGWQGGKPSRPKCNFKKLNLTATS